MPLPDPHPGLVICYSYLWTTEHRGGQDEGLKHRPCVIVVARQALADKTLVTVVPVTHAPPSDLHTAVEIPPQIKAHLGLDALPSWIVVSEVNDFVWPGPDLRHVAGSQPPRFEYGVLPPRFFRGVPIDCSPSTPHAACKQFHALNRVTATIHERNRWTRH